MNYAFTNGKILDGSRDMQVQTGRCILVKNGKIHDIVSDTTDLSGYTKIDLKGHYILPGLINMHTHNYMTVFRNLADDVSFNEWLFERVMPREDKMTPEDAYLGATLGIMEMLRSGTTCFNDMQMHIHQTTKAAVDAGIRGAMLSGTVAGYPVVDLYYGPPRTVHLHRQIYAEGSCHRAGEERSSAYSSVGEHLRG